MKLNFFLLAQNFVEMHHCMFQMFELYVNETFLNTLQRQAIRSSNVIGRMAEAVLYFISFHFISFI